MLGKAPGVVASCARGRFLIYGEIRSPRLHAKSGRSLWRTVHRSRRREEGGLCVVFMELSYALLRLYVYGSPIVDREEDILEP
jgi:hypothetical protein